MCFAAGPCALCSQYTSALHLILLCSQHVFWFVQREVTHLGVVEMLFVIGSALMLNRLHVQAVCEAAAAHIAVCLSVRLSVCLAMHVQQPLPELIICVYMDMYICIWIYTYS